VHRLDGVEIGAYRQHVLARHLGVGGERHRRVEPGAVRPYATAQRSVELIVGPGADPGVGPV
jgi:hypothetical protein